MKKLPLAVNGNKKRSIIVGVLGTAFILGMGIVALKWWTTAQNPSAIASVGGEVLTLPVPEAPAALVMGKYPYYLQADPAWANMPVGSSGEPMSAVGCTLTSIAMGLSGLGYPLTPGEVNAKLTSNAGLTDNGYVIWNKVATLTKGAVAVVPVDNSYARIDRELAANRPVIVKVLLGGIVQHWVLVVGKEGQEYIALDSLNKTKKPVLLSSLSSKIYAVRVFN
ncbi:C39 family peptidase [Thiothrix unzii]|jgi:hypothetical protein|uniref:Peptidase C39-like domain-containing protein n=1 Tax=Thiothrix lacustris TaxID=525917 RepID=A0A1Y1QY57_9GAMM|nr:C39 family peptidase [Thiothrix unzii]MDX9990142.1 C39 family peptidase [Thiothrix unzii]OQX16498.1 MAG: hypothetical protein BWK73_03630 [Thiothrix lacustris]